MNPIFSGEKFDIHSLGESSSSSKSEGDLEISRIDQIISSLSGKLFLLEKRQTDLMNEIKQLFVERERVFNVNIFQEDAYPVDLGEKKEELEQLKGKVVREGGGGDSPKKTIEVIEREIKPVEKRIKELSESKAILEKYKQSVIENLRKSKVLEKGMLEKNIREINENPFAGKSFCNSLPNLLHPSARNVKESLNKRIQSIEQEICQIEEKSQQITSNDIFGNKEIHENKILLIQQEKLLNFLLEKKKYFQEKLELENKIVILEEQIAEYQKHAHQMKLSSHEYIANEKELAYLHKQIRNLTKEKELLLQNARAMDEKHPDLVEEALDEMIDQVIDEMGESTGTKELFLFKPQPKQKLPPVEKHPDFVEDYLDEMLSHHMEIESRQAPSEMGSLPEPSAQELSAEKVVHLSQGVNPEPIQEKVLEELPKNFEEISIQGEVNQSPSENVQKDFTKLSLLDRISEATTASGNPPLVQSILALGPRGKEWKVSYEDPQCSSLMRALTSLPESTLMAQQEDLPPILQLIVACAQDERLLPIWDKLVKSFPVNVDICSPYQDLPPLLQLLFHCKKASYVEEVLKRLTSDVPLDAPYEKLPATVRMLVDLRIDSPNNPYILPLFMDVVTSGKVVVQDWKRLTPSSSGSKIEEFTFTLSKGLSTVGSFFKVSFQMNIPAQMKLRFNRTDNSIEYVGNTLPNIQIPAWIWYGSWAQAGALKKVVVVKEGVLKFDFDLAPIASRTLQVLGKSEALNKEFSIGWILGILQELKLDWK